MYLQTKFSHIYLGQELVLAGTIGAAIIVGVLGLPPTAITWCVLGEPMTYQTNNKVNNYSLRVIFRPSFLK